MLHRHGFATFSGVIGNEITGAGLEQLVSLPQLDELYLRSTQVTEESVPHLQAMPQLRRIILDLPKLTDVAIANLKRALPEARIILHPSMIQERRIFNPSANS
jgi:hypothetical protein